MEDTANVQRFSVCGLTGDYRIRWYLAVATELPCEFSLAKDLITS